MAPQTPKSANGSSQKGGDPASDRLLIDRCLKGDVEAWEQIYLECHPALMTSIRMQPSFQQPGSRRPDSNLVEEIAARVWFSLTTDGAGRLARFDKTRGCRLSTYLALLAKDEAKRYFRSEERRRKRELMAIRPRNGHFSSEERMDMTEAAMADFLETLTAKEQEYYARNLASPGEPGVRDGISSGNTWQLRHRIHQKLLDFLEQES